jgi:CRP/FNR family cyclic AMP-dependent transcriptional regulator
MTLEDTLAFLRKVPLFHGLNDSQLRKMARHFREREYAPDTAILEQGKKGVGLFIMVSGEAKVIREQIDGESIELDRLRPTDFFGELSLLDDAPRAANVIAVEPTKCLVLEKLLFMEEIGSDAEVAVAMLKTMAGRYRRLIQNM